MVCSIIPELADASGAAPVIPDTKHYPTVYQSTALSSLIVSPAAQQCLPGRRPAAKGPASRPPINRKSLTPKQDLPTIELMIRRCLNIGAGGMGTLLSGWRTLLTGLLIFPGNVPAQTHVNRMSISARHYVG